MGSGPHPPSGKSQVAIRFLSDTGTDPLENQLGPSGLNASRLRLVRPSVKTLKT